MTYDDYFNNRNISKNNYTDSPLQKYLMQVLPNDKMIKILDIGCGLGQTLNALKNNGYNNIKGIDISADAIAQCRSNGHDVDLISDIISFCKNNRNKFDFIIMSHVLEHIPKHKIIDTLKVINKKILKREGLLCIMVPNAQSNTDCYWAYEDFTHTVLFTSGSIYYVLREAGFSKVKYLDINGLDETKIYYKIFKHILLKIYKANKRLWNRVTSSSYHEPSPQIYTYEIKVLAIK
jgi:predicted TPR repeat methyltransferase